MVDRDRRACERQCERGHGPAHVREQQRQAAAEPGDDRRASASSCRTSRPGPAPMARRPPSRAASPAARASIRLATLAQAMSRTRPTNASSSVSGGREVVAEHRRRRRRAAATSRRLASVAVRNSGLADRRGGFVANGVVDRFERRRAPARTRRPAFGGQNAQPRRCCGRSRHGAPAGRVVVASRGRAPRRASRRRSRAVRRRRW